MPLVLTVTLIVIAVAIVVGVGGYLIDSSAEPYDDKDV
jgi:hypothetical protein